MDPSALGALSGANPGGHACNLRLAKIILIKQTLEFGGKFGDAGQQVPVIALTQPGLTSPIGEGLFCDDNALRWPVPFLRVGATA